MRCSKRRMDMIQIDAIQQKDELKLEIKIFATGKNGVRVMDMVKAIQKWLDANGYSYITRGVPE